MSAARIANALKPHFEFVAAHLSASDGGVKQNTDVVEAAPARDNLAAAPVLLRPTQEALQDV